MSQTTKIAFALFIGFIVYITIKGQLPYYLGVVGLSKTGVGSQTSGASNSNTSSSSGSGIGSDLEKYAEGFIF